MASNPTRDQPKAGDNLNSSLGPGDVVDVGYVDINDYANNSITKNSQSDYAEIPLPEGAAVDAITATVTHKNTTQTTSKHLATPSQKKIVDVGYVQIFSQVHQGNDVIAKSESRNLDYQEISVGIPTIIIGEYPEVQEPETNYEKQSDLVSQPKPNVVDVGYVQIFNGAKNSSGDNSKNAQDTQMDLEYTELPTPTPTPGPSHICANLKKSKSKPKSGSKSSGSVVDVGYVQIFRASNNDKKLKHYQNNLALDLNFDPDYAQLPIPQTQNQSTQATAAYNPNEPAVLTVESQMMRSDFVSTPSGENDPSTFLKDDPNSQVHLDDVQLRFKNDISCNEHESASTNEEGCCVSCRNICLTCAFVSCVGCTGCVGTICGCCCSSCDR